MFDNFRTRMKTRQAYLNAPVTYEVLGIQADERDIGWFTRNFGHRTLQAMFWVYFCYGVVMATAMMAFVTEEWFDGLAILIGLSIVMAIQILAQKYESKKVT